MDLSSIAQDLYGLPPAEFIAARKESVTAARAAGDAELSEAVGSLRKPSAAASAVNLLARHRQELLQEVVELGGELRAAQQRANGARLRELNDDRKALLKRLSSEVIELAAEHDLSHSPAVVSDVEETIKAALADPEAAKAVQAGILVTALSAAGLGYADVADSVALPDFALPEFAAKSRPRGRRLKAVPDPPEPSSARADAARQALAEAAQRAQQAEADLEGSEAARDVNGAARTDLHERLADLELELREVKADVARAEATVRDLDRAVVLATRAREAARKELARAEQRMDRLS